MAKNPEITSVESDVTESAKRARRLFDLDGRKAKFVAGTAGLLAMSGAIAACDTDTAEPTGSSPMNTEASVDSTVSPSPEVSEAPEVKPYDAVIEQINPQEYVIRSGEDPNPDMLAKALIDREEKITNLFANPEGIELANTWDADMFDAGDMNADMDRFRRDQCQKVVDKLSDTYYASTVDTAADTRNIDTIGTDCYVWYTLETKAIADSFDLEHDVSVDPGATLTVLEDGTYIIEAIVRTTSNVNELDPEAGYFKNEHYTWHLTNEDGEVRVISTTTEKI
ncbi:hypothetical protein GW930_01785 [Candidatus Saccharibacteria bacterium]|nr:hypothetical protein [Candidatus Saccharibacteria bacterium]